MGLGGEDQLTTEKAHCLKSWGKYQNPSSLNHLLALEID